MYSRIQLLSRNIVNKQLVSRTAAMKVLRNVEESSRNHNLVMTTRSRKKQVYNQSFLGLRSFSSSKKPNLRKSLNENEKIMILSNQNMRCNMCSERLIVHSFTKRKLFDFDHIQPRSKNGSTEVKNMQALCKNCHAIKTAWDLS